MKRFWCNKIPLFVVLFIVTSCATHTYKRSSTLGTYNAVPVANFFQTDSVCYFKTSINTYGKALSGILAVKRMHKDTLKVSFFTEMGVSFFDAVVSHDSYTLMRCIPQLESKSIMNTILEDIRWVVLFNLNQLSDPLEVKTDCALKLVRYSYRDAFIYMHLSKDNHPLLLTYVYGSKFKSKFELNYASFENQTPTKILVKHYNFDLKIELTKIDFSI
jgi:hypothetical protein